MRLFARITVAAAVVAMVFSAAAAQDPLRRQDRQGPVTVAVTPTSPLAPETPLRFRIALDTHSVALDDVVLERAVVLRTADGKDLAPSAVEQPKGGGHHREAVIVFPPVTERGEVRVVVKNVGGVEERVFTWPLPTAR